MLSLSADITESEIDLQMVNGDETGGASDIEYGNALMKFAESFARRDEAELSVTRDALLQKAGAEVLVDAAAVAANFQRMVRIADSMGIPVDERKEISAVRDAVAEELDLRRFASAQNTPTGGQTEKI